jgi:hypothetical protein
MSEPMRGYCHALSAETAGLATVELLALSKVREGYHAVGQTKFAPIALKKNATFTMLKSTGLMTSTEV